MFIHENFLLENEAGRKLYREVASKQPIFDYHCHLDPQLIVENYRYLDITELWLAGDHYKWRGMRANGVSEKYISGSASSLEKFCKWAETLEYSMGNPLLHWTQLELKAYFGITELLTSKNAERIYQQCNRYLAEHKVTTQSLIEDSNVYLVGTTDDVTSELSAHQQFAKEEHSFKLVPTFRPDKALAIHLNFAEWIQECQIKFQVSIQSYTDLMTFLFQRMQFFNENGCVSSDHGIGKLYFSEAVSEAELDRIFHQAIDGEVLSEEVQFMWQSALLQDLAQKYAELGWVMQIHFGVTRNNNSRIYQQIGADAGADSILDQGDIAYHLNHFLDALDKKDKLPKMVVYNLNSGVSEVVASTLGNFQLNESGIKSKLQFGAGWWFNDTYPGMLRQMEIFENYGLLSTFVGMVTDSRSFVSYPRHDYFRRILCNQIGSKIESGFYPNAPEIVERMVADICFNNAQRFFTNEKGWAAK